MNLMNKSEQKKVKELVDILKNINDKENKGKFEYCKIYSQYKDGILKISQQVSFKYAQFLYILAMLIFTAAFGLFPYLLFPPHIKFRILAITIGFLFALIFDFIDIYTNSKNYNKFLALNIYTKDVEIGIIEPKHKSIIYLLFKSFFYHKNSINLKEFDHIQCKNKKVITETKYTSTTDYFKDLILKKGKYEKTFRFIQSSKYPVNIMNLLLKLKRSERYLSSDIKIKNSRIKSNFDKKEIEPISPILFIICLLLIIVPAIPINNLYKEYKQYPKKPPIIKLSDIHNELAKKDYVYAEIADYEYDFNYLQSIRIIDLDNFCIVRNNQNDNILVVSKDTESTRLDENYFLELKLKGLVHKMSLKHYKKSIELGKKFAIDHERENIYIISTHVGPTNSLIGIIILSLFVLTGFVILIINDYHIHLLNFIKKDLNNKK